MRRLRQSTYQRHAGANQCAFRCSRGAVPAIPAIARRRCCSRVRAYERAKIDNRARTLAISFAAAALCNYSVRLELANEAVTQLDENLERFRA